MACLVVSVSLLINSVSLLSENRSLGPRNLIGQCPSIFPATLLMEALRGYASFKLGFE